MRERESKLEAIDEQLVRAVLAAMYVLSSGGDSLTKLSGVVRRRLRGPDELTLDRHDGVRQVEDCRLRPGLHWRETDSARKVICPRRHVAGLCGTVLGSSPVGLGFGQMGFGLG